MNNDRNGGDDTATYFDTGTDAMINNIIGVELRDNHNEDVATRDEMARSQYSAGTISTLLAKFAVSLTLNMEV